MRSMVAMLLIWIIFLGFLSFVCISSCDKLNQIIQEDGLKAVVETIWEGKKGR
ncbi:MAG TPA: hypothetical protein VMV86_04515 [Methanosarcinales archaeon]|nr:hypothetical protein [Methanosarcinales archaeon]